MCLPLTLIVYAWLSNFVKFLTMTGKPTTPGMPENLVNIGFSAVSVSID